MFKLEDRVALVTGGSRGIGKAVSILLAGLGACVVVNYSSSGEAAEGVVEEINARGGKAIALGGDVSKAAEAAVLVENTMNNYGRLDILVNNAGITRDNLIMRMKDEEWQRVIDINLTGAFNCTKAAVRPMMRQRSGRIINISSVVGIRGNAGQANYSASKAGIIGLTKAVAKEVGSRNITVNAVAPGYIQTDMTEVLSDGVKDEMVKRIVLGRPGKPEDVAWLVAFLASDLSSYITGQIIGVDGGIVM
ncbi:MAG: 3-oxoacyl-[acyl-carrier protein] reductase [Firmicutes bacterium]|nr:3-oxoacyl-[acyl-carrier protein] reductase [Bacillota bacterium]MDI6704635.1 3-oxoacyl-[acyl-carrier-protein] reductase [Bacillota bacterium]